MQAPATWMQPATPKKKRAYYLYLDGCQVPVTEEVYREYYRCRDQERYGERRSRRRVVSTQYLDTKHVPWEYQQYQEEQFIMRRDQRKRAMQAALELLDERDQRLIKELFIKGVSEKALARKYGVCQQMISKRKAQILNKLKKDILFFLKE